jgi:hypothetical protein
MPDNPPETESADRDGAASVEQTPDQPVTAAKVTSAKVNSAKATARTAPAAVAKRAPAKAAGGKAARRQGRNAARAEAQRLRREREEAEKEQRDRERRRRRLIFTLVALLLAGGVIVFDWYALHHSKKKPTGAIPTAPASTATGRDTPPPWPAPSDPAARVAAAGLPMLGAEGTALHIHVHLDVIVDGQPVTVPAEIGIDEAGGQISPLHTHDTTGVVHVESPTQAQFSLGQFFTEWQVSLAADHVGGLTAAGDDQLRTYVNGKPYDGDPAGIILHAHDEIAVVYGTAAQRQNPPSTYKFAAGL